MNHKNLELLKLGVQIIAETENESLEGTIIDFNILRELIELDKVRNLKTNYLYRSSIFLNLHSIKVIKILSSKNCSGPNTKQSEEHNSITTTTPTTTDDVESNALMAINKNSLNNIKIVKKFDQIYKRAIDHLSATSEIVIQIVCNNVKISYMTIATNENIYIFDINELKRLHPDLKRILESTYPRKIVHDGFIVKELIQINLNVELNAVLDTLVMFKRLYKTKEQRTLIEIIEIVLKVPNNELYEPKHNEICKEPAMNMNMLSRLAAHHLSLFQCMLHNDLLSNFYARCSKFSKTFSAIDDRCEAAISMQPHKNTGFNEIDVYNREWTKHLTGISNDI